MDPNANLEELRRLVKSIQARQDEGYLEWQKKNQIEDGERLAELVQALDEWISKGGFLPKAWVTGQEEKRLADEVIGEIVAEEKAEEGGR